MFEGLTPELHRRARRVRLLALDVDGVLTDGGLFYGADGESLKRFHVRDGMGIRLLREQGYRIAVISARSGAPLRRRLQDLGIVDVIEGAQDKLAALAELANRAAIELSECAFVGDDLVDLAALGAVGLAVAVADAHPLVLERAAYVTRARGGQGAVREVADLLLHASGKLESAVEAVLSARPAGFGVIIPARWASTRLPGKPLCLLQGKPMVLHVCDNAKKSGAEFVLVATDDARIERVVREAGEDVIMTSAEHRSGTDRLAEVIEKRGAAASALLVNVQGDEPLLSPGLIGLVGTRLAARPRAGMATLAAPICSTSELVNPHIVKVVINQQGFAQYFSRAPIPFVRDATEVSGEAAPPGALPAGLVALRHIGVYAYRAGALLKIAAQPPVMAEVCESLEQLRALWLGIDIHVSVVKAAPAHGVDTPADLARIEQLLGERSAEAPWAAIEHVA